jgi:hypothetical protein
MTGRFEPPAIGLIYFDVGFLDHRFLRCGIVGSSFLSISKRILGAALCPAIVFTV